MDFAVAHVIVRPVGGIAIRSPTESNHRTGRRRSTDQIETRSNAFSCLTDGHGDFHASLYVGLGSETKCEVRIILRVYGVYVREIQRTARESRAKEVYGDEERREGEVKGARDRARAALGL